MQQRTTVMWPVTITICLMVYESTECRANEGEVRAAVVKVWTSGNSLNLSSPWKKGTPSSRSGSGVWIGDNRILTNDHVITYAAQVSVQMHDSAERLPASVVISSPEMDLAILELDHPVPFDDVKPVEFAAALPELQSPVQVIGYPTGGSTISVTEGVVSRIEHRAYSHGAEGLRIQVDAAINPGNSGGPAVADGKVIGIAFQKRSRSDNIGYLIPSEEVATFLNDVEDGNYDGKRSLRITYQKLLNRGLRESLGLDSDTTGVVVREVLSKVEGYPLLVGDVITHIGTNDLDNSGVAKFSDELRFKLSYFASVLEKDGVVSLTIVRDGEELKLDVPLEVTPPQVFRSLKGGYPEYFVYGPLVFVEATADFFNALEAGSLSSSTTSRARTVAMMRLLSQRKSPLITRRYDEPAFEGEQLVMLSNSLPHKLSLGYSSPSTNVLKIVNGTEIRNMRHLVETLRDVKAEYIRLEFVSKLTETLVFSREQIEAASEEILADNGISRRASAELLKVWEAK